MKISHLAVLALIVDASEGFVVPNAKPVNTLSTRKTQGSFTAISLTKTDPSSIDDNEKPEKKPSKLRRLFSNTKKSLAFVTLASSAIAAVPKTAQASAPVMAMPKAEARDPLTDALDIHQRKMQAKAQAELKSFNAKARQIEAEQGLGAREKFEAEYKADQDKQAQERLDKIKQLKYHLLDEGICPFTDLEGQRRVFEAEKGLDPASVSGTRFNMEKEMEERRPQKSFAYLKQPNRAMIKAMVTDMKNRGMDPLEYFQKHTDKTVGILELAPAQAAAYAAKYNENLELYGQISLPKEGELSAKELMAKNGKSSAVDKAAAKQKAKELKEKAKAEKAAAKQEAKELKKKAKEEAKKQKEAAKAATAAAMAAATGAAVGAAELAAQTAAEVVDSVPNTSEATVVGESTSEETGEVAEVSDGSTGVESTDKKSKAIPIIPLAGTVIAVGGGGYALKLMRDKAAADEEERQRQFKLLMGGLEEEVSTFSAKALEEVDTDVGGFSAEESKSIEDVDDLASKALKKKKKRGIFAKKKNGRETDIDMLVANEAKAPEFAKLLAKILTFGAPGRFPGIITMPGGMPMEAFDVDAACEMLTEAQETANLSKEEAAEVFANVVNCMLIDIVDLASTSLKEKDEKLTVDAIGIVVDYMNHAASLYNSIAEGVVITPVTYGGDLRKGTLEQMFSAYAASGMTNFMNMDEDFQNRVDLLQDVFQISEKKAEGLVMKAVQKGMMEALKSGEGLEGMEEMMKGMDMEGMAGMPGVGEDGEMDAEQLKEVLRQVKTLKDSGALPPDQLKEVKDAFKESYGATFDDVIKQAESEFGAEDAELLELMKSVLYEE